LVMASSKQVVCLFHHICCSGTPEMVTKDPAFVSLFGNDMAKMMAVYHHHHTHTHNPGEDTCQIIH
jgi:zinc transport system ATP-binding protein